MKKLCLLLIIVLVFFVQAVFAETLSLDGEECTVDMGKTTKIDLKLKAPKALAISQTDVVTREGTAYIVTSGTLKYSLDMAKFPAILTFTQDIYASFEAYLACDDPNSIQEELIKEQISFFLYDQETGLMVYIYSNGEDKLSRLVDNFSELSTQNQDAVIRNIGSGASAMQCGKMTWIELSESKLATIVNGRYVFVEYGGSGDAAADRQDIMTILSGLMIS